MPRKVLREVGGGSPPGSASSAVRVGPARGRAEKFSVGPAERARPADDRRDYFVGLDSVAFESARFAWDEVVCWSQVVYCVAAAAG